MEHCVGYVLVFSRRFRKALDETFRYEEGRYAREGYGEDSRVDDCFDADILVRPRSFHSILWSIFFHRRNDRGFLGVARFRRYEESWWSIVGE